MNRWLCITVLALTGPMAWSAMTIQGYQSKLHDRFYVGGDRAFIGEAYNWTGVRGTDEWAVMISPSYFITSFHARTNTQATFYPDNTTSTPLTYLVDGGYSRRLKIVGGLYDGLGSDLELRRFTTPVAASIAKYPIAVSASETDFVNSTLWVYGADNRVGRNELNNSCMPGGPLPNLAYVVVPTATDMTYCSIFDYDSTGGVGVDEAGLQEGDSSGPTFVVIGGQLALEGIHVGVDPGYDPDAEFDVFLPYYFDQLDSWIRADSILAGNPEAPTSLSLAIPEPAGLLLLAAAAGLTLRRRTRPTA